MNSIDKSIDNILESYEKYGGINLDEACIFPNRQNVVSVLNDILSLIFPGYKTAELLDRDTLRYITGEKVNRIILMLTKEVQKSFVYVKNSTTVESSHCYKMAEQAALALIDELPELSIQYKYKWNGNKYQNMIILAYQL